AVSGGVVYSLTPPTTPGAPWTEAILHVFDPDLEISSPFAELVADAAGTLYGTGTQSAFPSTGGGVFALTPPATQGGPWNEKILHVFRISASAPDGWDPFAPVVIDQAGNFFGTTVRGVTIEGGGTVFTMDSSGRGEQILHNFTNNPD